MAYENTGLLARNERKEKDTNPDFSGTINVEGVDYWLSGWTKEGREGTKLAGKRYFSLSVKPKNPRDGGAPGPTSVPTSKPASRTDGDDVYGDVPF